MHITDPIHTPNAAVLTCNERKRSPVSFSSLSFVLSLERQRDAALQRPHCLRAAATVASGCPVGFPDAPEGQAGKRDRVRRASRVSGRAVASGRVPGATGGGDSGIKQGEMHLGFGCVERERPSRSLLRLTRALEGGPEVRGRRWRGQNQEGLTWRRKPRSLPGEVASNRGRRQGVVGTAEGGRVCAGLTQTQLGDRSH